MVFGVFFYYCYLFFCSINGWTYFKQFLVMCHHVLHMCNATCKHFFYISKVTLNKCNSSRALLADMSCITVTCCNHISSQPKNKFLNDIKETNMCMWSTSYLYNPFNFLLKETVSWFLCDKQEVHESNQSRGKERWRTVIKTMMCLYRAVNGKKF